MVRDMNNARTLREYLEIQARDYYNIASEFDNYSPKNELYTGYVRMCDEMLHYLSEETLEQPVAFRKINYCGECGRYNKSSCVCRDEFGKVITWMRFENTEACDCFEY